jgi:hypothetical protein
MGHSLQSQRPASDRVIPVTLNLTQSPISQHEMDDQNEGNRGESHYQSFASVGEAFFEPSSETQFLKEPLQNN